MESMKIRLEIEREYTLTPKVSKHATMARGVLVSRDRDAPAAAHSAAARRGPPLAQLNTEGVTYI